MSIDGRLANTELVGFMLAEVKFIDGWCGRCMLVEAIRFVVAGKITGSSTAVNGKLSDAATFEARLAEGILGDERYVVERLAGAV